eukprot:m.20038 g.20038  ORF g.20038 m.20038 type:complete len:166 (+) comp27957_c0_seq3:792-1289(+)
MTALARLWHVGKKAFLQPRTIRSSLGWIRPLATNSGRLYSEDHEWIKVENGSKVTIGISDFAQQQLGEIVYCELPEVGSSFSQSDEFGLVESVKSSSALYMPVSGEVTEINANLSSEKAEEEHDTSIINKSPYDEGWMIKVNLTDKSELQGLMDEEAYEKFTGNQ